MLLPGVSYVSHSAEGGAGRVVAARPRIVAARSADVVVLDRAKRPVLAMDANGADTVTLDGRPVTIGTALDLTALAAGGHRLTVSVTDTGGTATAKLSFIIAAFRIGLAELVLRAHASSKESAKMLSALGAGDYRGLIKEAKKARISADWRDRIIQEADALRH